MNMTVGERIKKQREALSMTQTALADKVGTTKQNIYKYETGIITNIPSDRLEAIAAALNVSPSYLMGWEGQLLAELSEEKQSGRTAAKDEMRRIFGTEHSAHAIYACKDKRKIAILYYKALERNAAFELSSILEKIEGMDAGELEKTRHLICAYFKADERIREIVDTALKPYDEPDPIDA